jgi:hypothetical protein
LNALEKSYDLAKLQSFSPEVFTGDKKASQEFCDFVLTTALFCNELKDLATFRRAILEASPVDPKDPKITPQKGNLGGQLAFVQRLYILTIHEMSNVFLANSGIIKSDEFMFYLKKLDKNQRQKWDDAVSLLLDRSKDNKFKKVLEVVRHKTAGHFEPKEIATGFSFYFINKENLMEPLISIGSGIPDTRFYFADAAMEGYLIKKHKDLNAKYLEKELGELIQHLYESMWIFVVRFVNARSAWIEPKLKSLPDPVEFEIDGYGV